MENKYYTAEEIEIGKIYSRGETPVILRERTGEKERHSSFSANSPLCDVYIFDELRHTYNDGSNYYNKPIQVIENKRVLLNTDYPCFTGFDLEKYMKERINPLHRQIENATNFLNQ